MVLEVKTDALKAVASEEKELTKTLHHLNDEIGEVRKNLRGTISDSVEEKIGRTMKRVENRLDETAGKMGKMGNALEEIASVYAKTEKNLTEERPQKS